jgi:hypothetical protein
LGGEIAGEIAARSFGFRVETFDFTQFGNVREGLADGEFEVAEVHGLGDEIERPSVHRGAQVGHVAIGRDDDRPHRGLSLAQFVQQGKAIHHGHVDVEQHQLDVRLRRQHCQGFLPVMGKAEGELPGTDLAAKPLPDQRLEIGLVIDAEDFDRLGQWGASGEDANWRNCAFR